jgi:hypothetical protein
MSQSAALAALSPVSSFTRAHTRVIGKKGREGPRFSVENDDSAGQPPIPSPTTPGTESSENPDDPVQLARLRHWQRVARRSTATYGRLGPWPRCTICTGPMVLGQVGAHGLCRAAADDEPDDGSEP